MRNLTAALELLERTPSSPERDRREFALQTSLGPALMATKGWAAPETEWAYLRAERLAETGATPEQQFRATGWIVWTALRRRQLERSPRTAEADSGISSIATPIRFSFSRRSIMTGRWRFPQVSWRSRNAMSIGGSSCSSRSFVRLPSRSTPLIIRPCAVMHGARSCHGCAVVPMRRGDTRSGPFHLRMNLETPCRQLSPCTRRHWFIA